MIEKKIKDIISKNDTDKLNFYLGRILNKCDGIEKENNRLGIIMLVLIFLFYLTGTAKAESISVGPILINKLESIKIFIPLVFAFVVFRYQVINFHKAELNRIIKIFSNDFFNFKNSDLEAIHTDDFTRSLIPLSIYEEVNKINYKKGFKKGCLGLVLVFPLLSGLSIAPFLLEYIWLSELIKNFSELDSYEKLSVLLTIWILILSIFYLINTVLISLNEQKEN